MPAGLPVPPSGLSLLRRPQYTAYETLVCNRIRTSPFTSELQPFPLELGLSERRNVNLYLEAQHVVTIRGNYLRKIPYI